MRNNWSDKSRGEKLAAVLYPGQVPEATRREMAALAANERKRAPSAETLLAHDARGAISPLGGVSRKSNQ